MQLAEFSERDTVSAVLIVKNEESYLNQCLESLTWCDEIVVVDSGSTDSTASICKNPNANWASKIRFIEHPWMGFSDQRNFAMDQCRFQWIFFLDGDEQCTPELKNKILELLSSKNRNAQSVEYRIHRQEFFLGKKINHGIWNPSYHIRLFKKGSLKFIGNIHEGTTGNNITEMIHESILHVQDLRIERFLNKLNSYTTIQAQNDYQSGMRTNLARILLSFPAMLYKNYIYYGAWKDGKEGLIISILEGISRTVRHLKIWQIEKIENNQRNR